MKPHPGGGPWSFAVGPLVFLSFILVLAMVVVIAWLSGRTEALVALGERARLRLDRARGISIVWGVSAAILVFAASVLLIQSHILALLGVLLLIAGDVLAAGGVAVAAFALGDDLQRALGGERDDPPAALRLGLWTLFFATSLPVLGWIVAVLAIAGGVGAVVESVLTGERLKRGG